MHKKKKLPVGKITQCLFSGSADHFGTFMARNGLSKYHDKNAPVVLFGLRLQSKVEKLMMHKGLAIVVYRGSDVRHLRKLTKELKKPNIKHVAISSFISDDLAEFGIEHKVIPLVGSDVSCMTGPLKPLGNTVYVYCPLTHTAVYGGNLIRRIKRKIPFKVNIVTSSEMHTREELASVYNNSFIGLRLTTHDGIANQVVEMGLRGIRVVHNGMQPNAIPWKNMHGIVRSIQAESRRIGTINQDVADAMKRYIDVGTDWLYERYWND